MKLKNPIIITARLLPGVQIDKAFVSVEYLVRRQADGRTRYRIVIDGIGKRPYVDRGIRSGVGGGDLREGLSSFLYFLSVAGDADHADLFSKRIREWAIQNSDEVMIAAHEVEETKDCIEE